MSEESISLSNCPRCQADLPADSVSGLCPRCLMAEAMQPTHGGAAAAPSLPSLTPVELAPHFPQLEILECLGRGGMGVVYKARQKSLGRLVALKLLAPERADDPDFAARFTREAQALAALNHAHIVTVHDFGESGGFYFLLMEFVDGVNLRQLLQAKRLSPQEALSIVPPICEALQCAHDHGIVHRDIKPENLLIDKAGHVKIADFGIAKILARDPVSPNKEAAAAEGQTAALGTPDYAAPEQHRDPSSIDHRADLYSLGVVLYEMLTGERPQGNVVPPSRRVQVDVRIDEIVLRALERSPELRFATATEFRTQVEIATGTAAVPNAPRPTASQLIDATSCYVTEPELLATFEGQFFLHRRKGQLILDDQKIVLVHAGIHTVIPLAAIRDLSLGQYPRVMNPRGLDFISLTYEETGQRRRFFLSPYTSFFGRPARFNQYVTLWYERMQKAVTSATGRAPARTPAAQLAVPPSSRGMVAMLLLLVGVAAIPAATILLQRQAARAVPAPRLATSISAPAWATPPERSIRKFTLVDRLITSDAKLLPSLHGQPQPGWQISGATPEQLSRELASAIEKFGEASPQATECRARLEARAHLVKQPRIVRLFEVPPPKIENCTVWYHARIRTEKLAGRAYLEMWCRFPGLGEAFSRGLDQTISGSNDWTSCQIPFFLKKGESPDRIRLNVVIEGEGEVDVRDIELSATLSPAVP